MPAFSRPLKLGNISFACIVLAGLTACGGGSGGDSTPPQMFITPSGDHSDTRDGAATIVPGQVIEGSFDSPDDVDFFRLSLAEPGTINVTLNAAPGTEIALLDSAGNVLTTATTASEVTASATTGNGDTYLRVRKRSRTEIGRDLYQLAVGPVVAVATNVKTLINWFRGIPDYTLEFGASISFAIPQEFVPGWTFNASLPFEFLSVTVTREKVEMKTVRGATPGRVTVKITATGLDRLETSEFFTVLLKAPNQPPRLRDGVFGRVNSRIAPQRGSYGPSKGFLRGRDTR